MDRDRVRRRTRKGGRSRRGAAIVEFAMVLPVMVLLMLGSIELGRGIMVEHTLQETAQAACRLYSVNDTVQQDVDDIIEDAMTLAGVTDYTVDYSPATKAEVDTHMEPVSVTISTDYASVAWLSPSYLVGATITGSCTLPADAGD